MRLSELSARSGVSVASVKFYLREGLLPPGSAGGQRAASYDERHLGRLRLIRALMDSGGLSVAAVRRVVTALDSQDVGWHDMLGQAQYALSAPKGRTGTSRANAGAPAGTPTPCCGAPDPSAAAAGGDRVSAYLTDWGWQVSPCSPFRAELATALEALCEAEVPIVAGDLGRYAAAMHAVAEVDLASVPRSSPEAALRQVVLGTVLLEPVLLAMRKLAQEDASRRQDG